MDLILSGATSQYIDGNGKLRMINYGTSLSLMTSPLPPLDLPENKTIYEARKKDLVRFLQDKSLSIKLQDQVGTKIQGVWLTPKDPLFYAYIPTEKTTDAFPNIDAAPPELNDPMRVDRGMSELDIMKQNRKIAEILQMYTLYAYSLNPEIYKDDYKKLFVIDESVKYDMTAGNILDKSLNILDSKGRVRVINRDIRRRLIAYLQISLLNDTPGVLALKNKRRNEKYYTTITDFRQVNGMVFTDVESLKRWKDNEKVLEETLTIRSNFESNLEEPYFYRNVVLGEKVVLIQNVDNSDGKGKERALTVSAKWNKDMVNIGYNPDIKENINEFSYNVVSSDGSEKLHTKTKSKDTPLQILEYENGTYAALLY